MSFNPILSQIIFSRNFLEQGCFLKQHFMLKHVYDKVWDFETCGGYMYVVEVANLLK